MWPVSVTEKTTGTEELVKFNFVRYRPCPYTMKTVNRTRCIFNVLQEHFNPRRPPWFCRIISEPPGERDSN